MRFSSWIVASVALAACGLVSTIGCNHRVIAGPSAEPKVVAELRDKLKAGEKAAGEGEAADTTEAATGWATIKGRFKLVGTAPTPVKINADKDQAVCGKHPLFDESVVVGKDGALQGAVIFVRTPKVEVHDSYKSTEADEVVLDNKDCRFEPHVAVLRSSQKLSLKNSDPIGHNSKVDGIKNAPLNVLIPADGTSVQKLGSEEQLPIKVGCSIHPWMGAWLVVRNDPYAAASDSTGSFTLANLPAGRELEFQLWQEKAGFLKGVQSEQVKVDGKGRFKLKLEPDQELVLDIAVPAEALK
jgi:hypothetical protein